MNSISSGLCAAVAISTLFSCAQRAPTDGQLKAYGEAKVAYASGNLAEAERTLLPLARGSSLPQARFLVGKTRFFLGNYDGASSVFKDLGRGIPKYHEADIWLARSCLQQGKIDESDRIVQELIANDSGDSRLYYLAAMIRVSQGDFKEALGFLERSSESGEELAKSYFEAARLYFRFGQDDKAVEWLKRADAMLPRESPMRETIAVLLRKLGKGIPK